MFNLRYAAFAVATGALSACDGTISSQEKLDTFKCPSDAENRVLVEEYETYNLVRLKGNVTTDSAHGSLGSGWIIVDHDADGSKFDILVDTAEEYCKTGKWPGLNAPLPDAP